MTLYTHNGLAHVGGSRSGEMTGITISDSDSDEPEQKYSSRSSSNICRIQFRNFACVTVSLPFFGLFFCVFWSLYSDFETATGTHCGVSNYLPSISAAVGHSEFTDLVFRVCIGLHAPARLYVTFMYYRYLGSVIRHDFILWALLACCLNALENLGLVGVAFTSSSLQYEYHKYCFVIFVWSYLLYAGALCIILKNCKRKHDFSTKHERKSLVFKQTLTIASIVALFGICYAFQRHNSHCEPGVYTVFAFLEYIFVLFNMGFHMTAYWDFYDRILTIPLPTLRNPPLHSDKRLLINRFL